MGCSPHRHFRGILHGIGGKPFVSGALGWLSDQPASGFCLRLKNKTKVFPSGGKERPSRDGTSWKVIMGMKITLGPIARHPHGVLGRPSRITGLKKVLGGILFCALLCHSVPATGTTVPAGQSVTLAWNPSTDVNVIGYNIYYGIASGIYTSKTDVGNATSATIPGLTAGVTYYFAITAYDSFGQESGYSSEISYLVPAPAPILQIRSAPAGQFSLTATGSPGQTYQILATQNFAAWTVIGTATVGADGSLNFTDPNAASYRQRFYRAVLTSIVVPTVQIRRAPGGQVILTVTGPAGQGYNVQATQDFTAWTVIGTATVGTSGTVDFTDPNAASYPRRFYRTQTTP